MGIWVLSVGFLDPVRFLYLSISLTEGESSVKSQLICTTSQPPNTSSPLI